MMENYDKWMHLWNKDLHAFERARSRMTEGGYTANSKYNQEVHDKDITLADKTEAKQTENMKDILSVTLRPQYDSQGQDWLASLRRTEHDNEFDGFKTLSTGMMKSKNDNQLDKRSESPTTRRNALG